MEEATLSPRAHMALLDGPEREQLDGKEKCPKKRFYYFDCTSLRCILPRNDIPDLSRSSGSLGFSEA